MKKLQRERRLPPLPSWFEALAVLRDRDVEIEEDGTSFHLRRQTVVVGQGGVFLLAQIPLRGGSAVQVRVSGTESESTFAARVESSRMGLGTLFRVSPEGLLQRQWKRLLSG